MLAHILQRFLHDRSTTVCWVSFSRADGAASSVAIARPDSAVIRADGVRDRAVEAQLVEDRRAELADERPDRAELAPEQLAQEAQLRPGEALVAVDDALDVLDLEDRVREDLGRPVVDLLGEPRSLRLLGLDDPHRELGREGGVAAHEAVVAALEEEPRALEVAQRDLDLRQLGLLRAQVVAELDHVRAERPGPVVLGAGLRGVGGRGRVVVRGDEPRPEVGRAALERSRARRAAPASGRALRCRRCGSARGCCAACCPRSRRPGRLGVERVDPGRRAGAARPAADGSRRRRGPSRGSRSSRASGCDRAASICRRVYGSPFTGRPPRRHGRRRAPRPAWGPRAREPPVVEALRARAALVEHPRPVAVLVADHDEQPCCRSAAARSSDGLGRLVRQGERLGAGGVRQPDREVRDDRALLRDRVRACAASAASSAA